MFSYIPANQVHGAPLIVVLHSCKQKAASFASDAGWFALSDRYGLALLFPDKKVCRAIFTTFISFPGSWPCRGPTIRTPASTGSNPKTQREIAGGGACRSGR